MVKKYRIAFFDASAPKRQIKQCNETRKNSTKMWNRIINPFLIFITNNKYLINKTPKLTVCE